MTFQPEKLDPSENFDDVADNDVSWITGKGQWVYWLDCNITVFLRDGNGDKDNGTMCNQRAGQGIVPAGVELYCFGGKVKQKEA
ncbi:hypothetical protein PDE_03991 [Penicillium oxalicum 114-2]|uniref:Uncharacterized protein n=1 Tax=Penicillium oxalicum (strain 114-2 / CGMCC 5302) TaxID=933388 RepID=S7ZFI1_PENO1|nr:hypothetical protein PDE_03991 [Penicillium oxalicum 114-2]